MKINMKCNWCHKWFETNIDGFLRMTFQNMEIEGIPFKRVQKICPLCHELTGSIFSLEENLEEKEKGKNNKSPEISPWQMYQLVRKYKFNFFTPGDTIIEGVITYECCFPWYWRIFFTIRLFIYQCILALKAEERRLK